MIEELRERVNGDEALVRRGRFLSTTFLLEVGSTAWLISIFEGRIVSVTPGPFVMPSSSFALRAPEDEWKKFWSKRPPPGSNDLMALTAALYAEGTPNLPPICVFKERWPKLTAAGVSTWPHWKPHWRYMHLGLFGRLASCHSKWRGRAAVPPPRNGTSRADEAEWIAPPPRNR